MDFAHPWVHAQSSNVIFGASGDYGYNSNTQLTFSKMGSSSLNFALALGDLSYNQGSAQAWCGAFRQQINNQAVEIIGGNHDSGETYPSSDTDNLNLFGSPLSLPGDYFCPYTLPGATSLTGIYGMEYYFDYPATNPLMRYIFVSAGITWNQPVVNGTGPYAVGPYTIGTTSPYNKWTYSPTESCPNNPTVGCHYYWAKNAIDNARTTGIPFVVLMLHKNCLTDGSSHTTCESGADIMNLAVSEKVDLYITLHEHNYERSVQLATNPSTCPSVTSSYNSACVVDPGPSIFNKGAGTIILTIGTGGEGGYACNGTGAWVIPQYFLQCQNPTGSGGSFGFVSFTVTTASLTGSFIASTGSYADSFSIVAGAGSVAYGTQITLASGARVPVQNVRVGDEVLLVDVNTAQLSRAVVYNIVTANVQTLLTIHTGYGEPLRIDANPRLWIHVQLSTGEVTWKRATMIVQGDMLYNQYAGGWVSVTAVSLAESGQHLMFDLKTTPFGDYLANGYADCPCKNGPGT